ncbi:MAG TPA: CPBP family intramembrane glutamic endopeptidase [Candidatus Sulfotelmatobacter sp.]|nr:CPBP family intramembrane glutamic endopeptidase [Candidatus Sulfotelmatobacter sp.]
MRLLSGAFHLASPARKHAASRKSCNQIAPAQLYVFLESNEVATLNSTSFAISTPQSDTSLRTLAELTIGFAAILVVLWLPTSVQLIFGPIALLAPLILVLLQRPTLSELGLHWRGFVSSLWILPAAVVVAAAGIFLARATGTFHVLYKPDLAHVGGYVLWTIYQQFLLQDYFMPRLTRVLKVDAAIAFAAVLFAIAHLPNVVLAVGTVAWGAVSCALFRRYRSLLVLGVAQGLLGLCFAVCVPEAYLHHMRVGLGYWHYHQPVAGHYTGYHETAGR